MRTPNSISYVWATLLLTFVSLNFAGCAGVVVQEDLPTISHVHIGHAVTGWKHTPDKQGLFVVAENMGVKALDEATAAQQEDLAIPMIKTHVENMVRAIDPDSINTEETKEFGLSDALIEAVDHITFAAESDDASQNVIDFTKQFETESELVLNRSKLIVAVGQEVLTSDSEIEIKALTEELLILNNINVHGDSSLNELGMAQLRTKLDEMINKEDPPYEPVATRYLFGIIRLPDGKWNYYWLANNRWDSSESEGGDGGGGGGGY